MRSASKSHLFAAKELVLSAVRQNVRFCPVKKILTGTLYRACKPLKYMNSWASSFSCFHQIITG
jgi:hypothetical protein